jgi:hypothetical protein
VGGAHPTWLEKKVKIGMVSPDSGFRIRILPGFRAPSLGGFPQEESSFIYRRNGRAFSGLTGRAGGLLNSLAIDIDISEIRGYRVSPSVN